MPDARFRHPHRIGHRTSLGDGVLNGPASIVRMIEFARLSSQPSFILDECLPKRLVRELPGYDAGIPARTEILASARI